MAFRVVQQSLWTDEKVMDFYSCEDKYFWLYLLTNPQTNQLGIYKLPIKLAAFQLGYSNEQVIVLLDRFEKTLKQIKYNKETQEVAIAYFLNHSIISGGAPVMSCIKKDLNNVKELELIDFVINKMENKTITNDTVGKIIELLKEKRAKKENILNINDNDNDNGDTYHDTCHDTYHDTQSEKKEEKKKPIKHRYGEFNHVLLTDDEKDKLIEQYGKSDFSSFIKILDEYIEMSGKKYKNHNLAIRKWVIERAKQNKNNTSSTGSNEMKPMQDRKF